MEKDVVLTQENHDQNADPNGIKHELYCLFINWEIMIYIQISSNFVQILHNMSSEGI